MKLSLSVILFILLFHLTGHTQSLIIGRHDIALFDSIPEVYIQAAADLNMMFMDRSVGWNISTFLDCLSEPWAEAPSFCKRYQHQDTLYAVDPSEVFWNGQWDRINWHYRFWPDGCSEDVTCFIDYMEERLDSFDVFGCQFSYLAVNEGANIADPVNGFFGDQGNENKASTYTAFATAHPDKKLIWWTTSLARGIGTPESESFNAQMREYAASHDIILFDVADILSHNPDGDPCYDNRDGVAYKDENHPDDGVDIPAICPHYTTETEGGHLGSISAGGVRVAKAFWVMMAHIAGWQDSITSTKYIVNSHFRLFPNPASSFVNISIEESSLTSGEILLVDVHGRVMNKMFFENSSEIQFPLDQITAGIYYIRITGGHRSHSEILVVK